MRCSNRTLILIPLLLFTVTQTGCGLLFGTVKPVTEKSETFRTRDLSEPTQPDGAPSDWVRLPSAAQTVIETANLENPESAEESIETSDIAFQSRSSAAIISVNSSCRPRNSRTKRTLREFTDELLFGFSDITERVEKPRVLNDMSALETTLQGRLNGERLRLRAVVLKREICVYDLMYIARPESFSKQEPDFDGFVESFVAR